VTPRALPFLPSSSCLLLQNCCIVLRLVCCSPLSFPLIFTQLSCHVLKHSHPYCPQPPLPPYELAVGTPLGARLFDPVSPHVVWLTICVSALSVEHTTKDREGCHVSTRHEVWGGQETLVYGSVHRTPVIKLVCKTSVVLTITSPRSSRSSPSCLVPLKLLGVCRDLQLLCLSCDASRRVCHACRLLLLLLLPSCWSRSGRSSSSRELGSLGPLDLAYLLF
jgi:hypothetical protein